MRESSLSISLGTRPPPPYAPAMPDGLELLKRGPHRSVWLAACGEIVVKRFHSRGRLRRATDGRRAHREARLLTQLADLGLPVPRVIALNRTSAGWELCIERIPNALSLEATIGSGLDSNAATSLGHTLSRFHAAGFLHGDLHPGNLLCSSPSDWFLIDVGNGRLRKRLPRADRVREVAELFAAIRERTAPEWRREVWRAWKPANSSPEPLPVREWHVVEERARRARQRAVLAHADRWSRPSSRLRAFEYAGEAWLINARAETAETTVRGLKTAEFDGERGRARAASGANLIRGPLARSCWSNAARAVEHELPMLRPLAWNRKRSLAVFEPTSDAAPRPVQEADVESTALAAALVDRGLWTANAPLVEFNASGGLVLAAEHEFPLEFVDGPATAAVEAWFAPSNDNLTGLAR